MCQQNKLRAVLINRMQYIVRLLYINNDFTVNSIIQPIAFKYCLDNRGPHIWFSEGTYLQTPCTWGLGWE